MSRINIDLDDETLAKLRHFAELRGLSTTALVADLIRQELRKQSIRDAAMTFQTNHRRR